MSADKCAFSLPLTAASKHWVSSMLAHESSEMQSSCLLNAWLIRLNVSFASCNPNKTSFGRATKRAYPQRADRNIPELNMSTFAVSQSTPTTATQQTHNQLKGWPNAKLLSVSPTFGYVGEERPLRANAARCMTIGCGALRKCAAARTLSPLARVRMRPGPHDTFGWNI